MCEAITRIIRDYAADLESIDGNVPAAAKAMEMSSFGGVVLQETPAKGSEEGNGTDDAQEVDAKNYGLRVKDVLR